MMDERVRKSNRVLLTPDGLFADHIVKEGYMD
jgi:hypothetical protein